MEVPFADLTAQYNAIREEIDAAIGDVIAETAFIGGRDNRFVSEFEARFSEFVGVRHCIGCANGTDALEILLKALEIGPGHEVIVPAHSWISTAEAVSAVGARPVFVDSRPGVYTIDPAGIDQRVTPRTRAIIPVHLYGLPADMDPILEVAHRHGLLVVEDSAQAHGATYKGRRVGTMGIAAAFSFYPGKNLGAYGDAGAMLTNDASIARRARMIANHGQEKKHDHLLEGRNSRLDGLQAAVLTVKLRHLDRWTEHRRGHAARYEEALSGLRLDLPLVPAGSTHVYHLFVVATDAREELRNAMRSAGVATAIHYPRALPMLPPYLAAGCRAEDYPTATRDSRRILSLPMYPEMTNPMIDHVAAIARRLLGPNGTA